MRYDICRSDGYDAHSCQDVKICLSDIMYCMYYSILCIVVCLTLGQLTQQNTLFLPNPRFAPFSSMVTTRAPALRVSRACKDIIYHKSPTIAPKTRKTIPKTTTQTTAKKSVSKPKKQSKPISQRKKS